MNPVGVALIGAGPWGLTLGRAMARLPDVDLRWICELDPARRAEAAGIAPGARLTGVLDEVLTDAGVAAAFVAVDSARHHPVGLRVLQADRHLMVEKPLALTVADASELSALAEARRRVLAVGHLLLHHPAVRRARKLIADGALGETLWLEAARLAPGPARTAGSVWWTLAPHDVSLALHLFDGVPREVTAVGGPGRAPGEETVVWATLRFDDGRLAHLHAARQAAEKKRGFSIVGTARALTFDELAAGGGALHLHDPRRAGGGTQADPVPVDVIDALGAQCRHFISGVARGDTGAGNGAHALAVVRVLEAGARSMCAGGAPIEVV
jgi:predicted dehydrogenase